MYRSANDAVVSYNDQEHILKRLESNPNMLESKSSSPTRPNCMVAWLNENCTSNKSTWKRLNLPVLDPWGSAYYYHLAVASVAVLYNVCVLIPRIAFDFLEQEDSEVHWYVFDYLADFLYAVDMLTECRKGYLEEGMLVVDKSKLHRKYLLSFTFRVHVISLLPTDILHFLHGWPLAAVRLNRMMRFPRLVEFFDRGWKVSLYPNLWRFCTLIFYLSLFLHYNACLYYETSKMIGFNSDEWVFSQTLYETYLGKYSYCFWWACQRVTMGDLPEADSNNELIFVLVNILLGMLIFATLYGNIGEILLQITAKMKQFHEWSAEIRLFMEKHRIPEPLQTKVVKWMEHFWNENRSIIGNEDAALRILPEKLRAEINMNAHLDTLRRVRIFQDCEPGLLVALVNKLKLVLFNPGEYVCVKGEVGKEMYFVKRGVLSVVSPDGLQVYSRLGAVLGELSLLNISGTKTGNRRTASVRSNGYTDLFCLTKEDLWSALKDFPEARRVFMEKGREILKKDGLLQDEFVNDSEQFFTHEEKINSLETKMGHMWHSMSLMTIGWATHLHQTHKRIKEMEAEISKYEEHGTERRLRRAERKRQKKWKQTEAEAERLASEMSNFSSSLSLSKD